MKKIFIIAFFALCLHASEISQKNVTAWLGDANLTCQQYAIDTLKTPKFRAYIELNNNKKLVFASVKSMLLYFYESGYKHGYIGIKELLVSDYKSGDVFNASDGFYVFGSRIVSAKGDDLIPFKNLADAKAFESEFLGHKILKFKEITKKLIDYLR